MPVKGHGPLQAPLRLRKSLVASEVSKEVGQVGGLSLEGSEREGWAAGWAA